VARTCQGQEINLELTRSINPKALTHTHVLAT
jgi:hypothetical protein